MLNRCIATLKSLFYINRYKMDIKSTLREMQSNIDQLMADKSSKLNITPRISDNLTDANMNVLIETLNSNFRSIEYSIANILNRISLIIPETTGFNSQNHRKIIFKELTAAINFENIIETGTFLGDTTYWMSLSSNLPIYTTEANSVFYGISKARFVYNQKIIIYNLDSHEFLKKLTETTDIYTKKVFIYLDSHWYKDLPLHDEMDFICSKIKEFVVMIDDFMVPDDIGYGYDDYGEDNVINLKYLSDILYKYNLSLYFPSLNSSEETGAKRGCAVLTNMLEIREIINNKVHTLKEYRIS